MSHKKRKVTLVLIGLLVCSSVVGLTLQNPLRWAASGIHRKIFPEQNPERPVYNDTTKGPVNLATFVRQARAAWPNQDVATVHRAAAEVAAGLLHHNDIEVGTLDGKTFVPWTKSRWDSAQKIRDELATTKDILADDSRYVFRRK